jgi:hypothetical protein
MERFYMIGAFRFMAFSYSCVLFLVALQPTNMAWLVTHRNA